MFEQQNLRSYNLLKIMGAKNQVFSTSKVSVVDLFRFRFSFFGSWPKREQYAYIVYCSAFISKTLLSQSPKIIK